MNWFNNLKIRTKLVALMVFLLSALAVNGIIGIQGLSNWGKTVDDFSDEVLPSIRNFNILNTHRMTVRSQTYLIFQAKNAEQARAIAQDAAKRRQATWQQVDQVWQELQNLNFQTQEQIDGFRDVSRVYRDWRAIYVNLDRTLNQLTQVQQDYAFAGLMDDYAKFIDAMLPISAELGVGMEKMLALNANRMQSYSADAKHFASSSQIQLISIIVVALILAILIGIMIIRSITRPLGLMVSTLENIDTTGNYSLKLNYSSRDEIGQAANALNRFMANLQGALAVTNSVVGAISQGDFSKRIEGTYAGDLAKLQEGVNTSADSINATVQELARVIQALNDGDFNINIDAQLAGDFGKLLNNVSGAMRSLNGTIRGVMDVMGEMQKGEFNSRVTVEAHGDLLVLKDMINDSMDTLDKAIEDITRIVVSQSKGDLTQQITNNYEGQLDTLKQAINTSISSLDEIVAVAVGAAQSVGSAASEVAQGAMDLSQRVQEQAAAVEESSATMEEFNVTVQNNAESAREANRVGHEVEDKTQQASEVMQQTIHAMTAIQESSHKISEIVTMIDSIAFQTNLLALNAAVEAARAGDHGRGFAVVAGEVRALAQKSAEAARDITGLINESVTRIDEGTKLATESGEVIADITRSITDMAGMNEHISQASGEQAEGVSQLQTAISQIDEVTQQNAALVEETSAAAESMRDQANILTERMNFFQTSQQSGIRKLAPASKPAKAAKPATPKLAAPATKAPALSENNSEEWAEF